MCLSVISKLLTSVCLADTTNFLIKLPEANNRHHSTHWSVYCPGFSIVLVAPLKDFLGHNM